MLDSIKETTFLQHEPELGQKNATRWKTYYGFLNEAKQLAQCLLRNRILHHEATISFDKDMSEGEHQEMWRVTCRNLTRAGLSYVWVREVDDDDRIHYHIMFADEEVNKATIKNAIPESHRSVSRVHKERIVNMFNMCFYFAKAKVAGNGLKDKHGAKRRWFKKNVKLSKWNASKSFWVKPKKKIWEGVKADERELAKYMTDETLQESQDTMLLLGQLGIDKLLGKTQSKLQRTIARRARNEAGVKEVSPLVKMRDEEHEDEDGLHVL